MKLLPLLALTAFTPFSSATIFFAGIAQSGGEFGAWSPTAQVGTGLPGRFGVEYSFISTTGVDVMVDTHRVNLMRVAFLLERMCPLAWGLGARFNESHFGHFKDAVDYITKTKGICKLSPLFPFLGYLLFLILTVQKMLSSTLTITCATITPLRNPLAVPSSATPLIPLPLLPRNSAPSGAN